MPRTEEQLEGIRGQKIELIMNTALELFANEGYYSTSISKIAQKAGISKGLMYNYFESKEDLIQGIIGKGISTLIDSIDPNRDGILTEEEFIYHIDEMFRILRENLDYWKLYFSMMMQPAVSKIVMSKYSELLSQLTVIFEDYFKRKGIADPVNEAIFYGAMLDGISINYILNPESFPLEKMKGMIIERFK